MIGMDFLGMGLVVAACFWIEVVAPVVLGFIAAGIFALFCWGGWIGRAVGLAGLVVLASMAMA